ncbi:MULTISPECIES: helix-turn-helix transcriptional regulator [unclassified Candidatus Frackibacter]|uniref:helix-turn-helix transcriptional regulator n=1 Tax=unclassified Candidatus Frackibacter TaxID=2648818 RepID=UPI00088C6485|nr:MULTISPECIES: WYL domain-containing transcriptional regulator [unclassified Candidatus Frackibacter]SDC86007.1 Predicted DNA-binding transcriptional regulator YafY, contains an HTH and WYL domains [Candidatus Frackibacter sp. WG11]SEN00330.1 Predicted DNA-binding transcriptional regulator YafY, contains an HTH and WYL domains [Candidatus Frackibacter sp. WG12]SFL55879.1 Predicted DNA-binding transcriptional regulator YafY, contains an HTH and WYL domains [Candidatus Frackibacter sp. WG13]
MSKAANMLNMLMILRSRGKTKTKRLAKILEVKPRTVRQYKDEFEQVGIYIGSIPGRNGGYYIERDNTILNLGINENEFSILKNAKEYLGQNGFMFIDEYELILDKINSNLQKKQDIESIGNLVLDSIPNVDLEEEKVKYSNMQEAIIMMNKVKIKYFSLTSGLNTRVIRPYAMYIYQGFWYVMAYCELRDAIRQFKLSRIKTLEVLDQEFKRPKDFSVGKYLEDTVGIVYDEEKFDVELKIDFSMSIKVSEKIWVKNQDITFNEDNSIIFRAKMTGLDDLVNWVLGLGSSVEVIKPEELKQRVKDEARRILAKN